MPISNQIVSFKLSSANFSGTVTQLNYTSGVNEGTALPSKALVLDSSKIISGIERINANTLNATNLIGTLTTSSQPNITSLGTLSNLIVSNNLTLSGHNGTNGLILGSTLVTSSANQLNYNNITTIGSGQASKALILDSSRNITNINLLTTAGLTLGSTAITASGTEINTLTGVTPGIVSLSKTVIVDSSKDITGFRNITLSGTLTATNLTGLLTTAAQTNITSLGSLTGLTTAVLTLGSTEITATGTEINNLAGITAGTVSLSKVVIVDANKDITGFRNISVTGTISGVTTLTATNLTGLLSTAAQTNITSLGSLTGLTTAGLTLGSTIITATGTEINKLAGLTATTTELNYLDISTIGSAQASKALILDSSLNISGINDITSTGIITFSNSTTTTSNSTGALKLAGGLSISNTTDAVSSTNGGTFTSAGGGSFAKSLFVGTNLTVGGNLTISGTTTSVNSTTVNVADNTIILNSGPAGTGIDAGILTQRYQIANDLGAGDIIGDTPTANFAISSGTTSTIVLPGSASAVDNYYTNWWIKMTNGSANNNVRKVTNYVGSTKTLTLETVLSATPSASNTINLYNNIYPTFIWQESNKRFITATTTIDSSGTIAISDYSDLASRNIILSSTTSSTSNSTGALKLSGGIGISNTTDATNSTNGGTFTSAGGGAFAKSLFVGTTLTTANLTLGATAITSTGTEINTLAGVSAGTISLSKAVVVDANKDISGFRNISLTGTISGVTTLTATSLTLSGALTGVSTIGASGVVSLTNNTTSSSTTTGALVVTGGVGIGGELNLAGNINLPNASTGINMGNTSNSGYCQIYMKTNTAQYSISTSGNGSSPNGLLQFHALNSSGGFLGTIMTMQGLNVGIGTTSPSYKLDINGSLNSTSFYLSGSQVTSSAAKLNYLDITTAGAAQASKALVLDNSGNISGINYLTSSYFFGNQFGTTTYLNNSALSTTTLGNMYNIICQNTSSTNGTSATIGFICDSTAPGGITPTARIEAYRTSTYGYGDLIFSTKGTITAGGACSERMRILANGNVGINNSNPGYTLDISGTLYVSNYINAGSSFYLGGTQVMDSSRNLLNIGSIGISGSLTATSGYVNTSSYYLSGNQIMDSSRNLINITSIGASSYINSNSDFRISSTTVIDSSRNLTNIGYLSASSFVASSSFMNCTGGYRINGTTVIDSSINLNSIGFVSGTNYYYSSKSSSSGTFVSNWASSSYFGLGPDTTSNDSRVRLGICNNAGVWTGGYANLRLEGLYASGYVGIGTASPSYPLHVTSSTSVTVTAQGFPNFSYGTRNGINVSFKCDYDMVCSTVWAFSDRRLKCDFNSLSNDFCKNFIMKTEPVSYKFKNGFII